MTSTVPIRTMTLARGGSAFRMRRTPSPVQDQRDQDQQAARLGSDVADPEPGRVVAPPSKPSFEAIHWPAIRISHHAGNATKSNDLKPSRGSVKRVAAPAEPEGRHGGGQPADEQHRAEHVQQQREVPVVRTDRGEHAHAPGL